MYTFLTIFNPLLCHTQTHTHQNSFELDVWANHDSLQQQGGKRGGGGPRTPPHSLALSPPHSLTRSLPHSRRHSQHRHPQSPTLSQPNTPFLPLFLPHSLPHSHPHSQPSSITSSVGSLRVGQREQGRGGGRVQTNKTSESFKGPGGMNLDQRISRSKRLNPPNTAP